MNTTPHEAPRARLIACGPENLTDAELLSLFMPQPCGALQRVERARERLARYGSLSACTLTDAATPEAAAALELSRRVLREKLERSSALCSPQAVRDYLRLKLQDKPHEIFVAVFLDAQNRVLAVDELFRGTLTQTSVYPREVVKAALRHNAAAVILAHNHPSGIAEPSRSDEALTQALKQALALVDVKVLDHFVIGAGAAMSFAERGLL